MTKNEKDNVLLFINTLVGRVEDAKDAIKRANYGQALDILSKVAPVLDICVDE